MDVKAGLEALIQAAQFLEENGGNLFYCQYLNLNSKMESNLTQLPLNK